jgi:hypothetical protein
VCHQSKLTHKRIDMLLLVDIGPSNVQICVVDVGGLSGCYWRGSRVSDGESCARNRGRVFLQGSGWGVGLLILRMGC